MLKVTQRFLRENKDHVFVFGDNTLRRGNRGGASLRGEPNTYGFITKKYPSLRDDAYFRVGEYQNVFALELRKLEYLVKANPKTTFLISPIGSGLANKYHIWERVIKPGIKTLGKYKNVIFLWEV